MNTTSPHCVVVGAGIVGACCAWHLVRSGARVTLVDRGEPGQATSFGNAGCISPSQLAPFSYPGVWKKVPRWLFDELGPLTIRWRDLPAVAPWLWRFWRAGTAAGVRRSAEAQARLMHRVTADWDELLARTGLSHYRQSKGLIVLFDSAAEFQADRWQYELDAELGFDWEILSPAELEIMAPAIEHRNGIALYIPSWQHVSDPARLTADIARAAINGGAAWVQDEVDTVRADEESVRVATSSGRILQADRLVVAAGPWSNRLVAQLDGPVPMTPKRGYHSMLANPGVALDYPVMSASRTFVMTPMAGGLRLAGTAEFAKLDAEPNYARARVLRQHARAYLPGLRDEEVTEWMGQRPMMVDSVPVISPSPRYASVLYAFGHGHYGLTQGPTTGAIIACLAMGTEPPVELAPYRIDRF